jgi:hypothetical protein
MTVLEIQHTGTYRSLSIQKMRSDLIWVCVASLGGYSYD